ncbi:DUF4249 domain-containing protein [Aequorivita capsosiphonis]|uniref:DUF4249 domain-containing protein n=1 Tax=Aequorivita capsosiphonis TaxID=487317 RepID=UPI00047B42C0|nr:DUF4249 domain-containing protein [Aequorivita capsosiphonis]
MSAAILFAVFILNFTSCTEEIDFKTETFESALVVQASLTNENAPQKVVLSRTFAFEDDGPPPESNATVTIIDDLNTTYEFQETENLGTYLSLTPFAASVGRQYTLNITTANGRTYQSAAVTLKAGTEIDQIYAQRSTNGENVDGVSIFLDSYDATNNSKYYRFEYEETYKIVSKFSSSRTFHVDENNRISLVQKTEEEKICYNTLESNNISLANTSTFAEDRLTRFSVRFLDARSPKIGKRYSILVRQYVISREAYTFYETLRNFSSSESLFSQVQPGFIAGNIQSTQNNNEKVIGIFDVATVSERRLFFNFEDLFFDGSQPGEFAGGCEESRPSIESLPSLINDNAVRFYFLASPDDPPELGEGPYYVMPRACIDCRAFGSNEVPDFWEE